MQSPAPPTPKRIRNESGYFSSGPPSVPSLGVPSPSPSWAANSPAVFSPATPGRCSPRTYVNPPSVSPAPKSPWYHGGSRCPPPAYTFPEFQADSPRQSAGLEETVFSLNVPSPYVAQSQPQPARPGGNVWSLELPPQEPFVVNPKGSSITAPFTSNSLQVHSGGGRLGYTAFNSGIACGNGQAQRDGNCRNFNYSAPAMPITLPENNVVWPSSPLPSPTHRQSEFVKDIFNAIEKFFAEFPACEEEAYSCYQGTVGGTASTATLGNRVPGPNPTGGFNAVHLDGFVIPRNVWSQAYEASRDRAKPKRKKPDSDEPEKELPKKGHKKAAEVLFKYLFSRDEIKTCTFSGYGRGGQKKLNEVKLHAITRGAIWLHSLPDGADYMRFNWRDPIDVDSQRSVEIENSIFKQRRNQLRREYMDQDAANAPRSQPPTQPHSQNQYHPSGIGNWGC